MKNNQIITYITPDVTEDEMREIIDKVRIIV